MEVQFQRPEEQRRQQFTRPETEVICWPPKDKTGSVIYPYTDAQH